MRWWAQPFAGKDSFMLNFKFALFLFLKTGLTEATSCIDLLKVVDCGQLAIIRLMEDRFNIFDWLVFAGLDMTEIWIIPFLIICIFMSFDNQ